MQTPPFGVRLLTRFAALLLAAAVTASAADRAPSGAPGGASEAVSAPGSSTVAAPAEFTSALLRTAIVVEDLEAAKRFYVDGLGLRVRYDGDITRPAVAYQLGLAPGQTAWFVVLDTATRLGDREVRSAMIGLLKVDHPAPPRLVRPERSPLAVGESMFAIETTRIVEVEKRLRALGATFVVPPRASPDGREIEMVVRDPVGTRVHVMQRLAPGAPATPAR